MAASPSPVSGLIQALRKASDPWERLRIVTRGARSLSHLPPEKRRALLHRIGLSGAEDLLVRLAGSSNPETAAAIQQAFDYLEQDPEAASRLARDLANPETRDTTLGGLIAHLEEVAEDVPEPETADDASGERAASSSPVTVDETKAPAPGSRPPEAEPEAPSARAAGEEEEEEEEEEELNAVRAARDEADEAASSSEMPQVVVEMQALEAEPSGDEAESVKSHMEDAADEAGRALRDLERRLEGLPAGWSRRRVLARELEGELGKDLDRALALVRRFAEPSETIWCLTALAAGHLRSDDEWERLVAAAETPGVRRRLEMRRPTLSRQGGGEHQ